MTTGELAALLLRYGSDLDVVLDDGTGHADGEAPRVIFVGGKAVIFS